MKRLDLTGKRFGKLLVLKSIGSRREGKRKYRWWLCKCDCGNIKAIRGGHLTSVGGTNSCGCLKVTKLLPEGESTFNSLFWSYKYQAKLRGIEFKLSKKLFRKLITQNCCYCDSKPTPTKKSKKSKGVFICNGIDRIDSTIGYTKENCVPCCKRCNWMKSDMNVSDFIEHCNKITTVNSVA